MRNPPAPFPAPVGYPDKARIPPAGSLPQKPIRDIPASRLGKL
jgi:hypothetical protein